MHLYGLSPKNMAMKSNWPSRRNFVITSAMVVAASLAGCPGDDNNDEEENDRSPEEIAVDWVSAADNVDDEDDIEDMTGEESVQIDHGVTGDQGNYVSEPGIVRIDSGTDVTYEWVSSGHSLSEIEGQGETISDWDDFDDTEGEGFEHTVTFEETGVALWECEPHRAQNHRGGVIVE